MSTTFTHLVVPISMGLALGTRTITPRLIGLGCLLSILPDIDVIGFFNGISYHSPYGHRGFTHSIAFAAVCGGLVTMMHHKLKAKPIVTFLFAAFSVLSHGLMDSMTYGGLGIAFYWPLSDNRHFLPWRPLPVPTIGIRHFFTYWGWYVFKTEMFRVWLPLIATALAFWSIRSGIRLLRGVRQPGSGEI